jgi:hypothetical protein
MIYHAFTIDLLCIYHAFTMDFPMKMLDVPWFFPCFPSRAVWAPLGPGLEEHRRVTDGEVRRGDLDGGPARTAAVRQTVQVEGLKDREMWPHMAPMENGWLMVNNSPWNMVNNDFLIMEYGIFIILMANNG